jgi:hypothetical protein
MTDTMIAESLLCLEWAALIKLANKKSKRTTYKIDNDQNQIYKLDRKSSAYLEFLALDDLNKLTFINTAIIGKSAKNKEEAV